MSPIPQPLWYSFDTINGMLYQPSSGVVWHPYNPYYDPGPLPLPAHLGLPMSSVRMVLFKSQTARIAIPAATARGLSSPLSVPICFGIRPWRTHTYRFSIPNARITLHTRLSTIYTYP
ncbi:hypothetical protein C2E23DRAFT_891314 [Lenzites betulinus]|nr:hypothetical protein C2E23DRAFT_891314 [Lenzites betulinus]